MSESRGHVRFYLLTSTLQQLQAVAELGGKPWTVPEVGALLLERAMTEADPAELARQLPERSEAPLSSETPQQRYTREARERATPRAGEPS